MRTAFVTLLTLVLFAAPVRAASVYQYDLTSGAQSASVSFTHRYCVDIDVAWRSSGPTDVVIDYLIPTNDLAEWGAFQTRGSGSRWSFSFPELHPTVETFDDQWLRVWWEIPEDFDWNYPVQFWIQYDFSGTRTQTLSGVSADFEVILGAPYTFLTTNVTTSQDVLDFTDYCESNAITNRPRPYSC